MKYKAKRIDNDEWVSGYYLPKALMTGENFNGFIETYGKEVGAIIVDENAIAYEVDPNTKCISTELFDKNGKEIYEEDVIDKLDTEISYGGVNGWFMRNEYWTRTFKQGLEHLYNSWNPNNIEVIGNIHDKEVE